MSRRFVLQKEHGATLVEYALVLLVFLTLILGIMEFGRVIFIYNTLANATREGARYGITHPGDATGTETAARALTTGLDPARLYLVVSPPG
jgi:Flp pilus assembly protein TadG